MFRGILQSHTHHQHDPRTGELMTDGQHRSTVRSTDGAGEYDCPRGSRGQQPTLEHGGRRPGRGRSHRGGAGTCSEPGTGHARPSQTSGDPCTGGFLPEHPPHWSCRRIPCTYPDWTTQRPARNAGKRKQHDHLTTPQVTKYPPRPRGDRPSFSVPCWLPLPSAPPARGSSRRASSLSPCCCIRPARAGIVPLRD